MTDVEKFVDENWGDNPPAMHHGQVVVWRDD